MAQKVNSMALGDKNIFLEFDINKHYYYRPVCAFFRNFFVWKLILMISMRYQG